MNAPTFWCHDCETFHAEHALTRSEDRDPFGTGDAWYVEVCVACPDCGSDEVEELVACDCGKQPPLDGFDDCAVCILTDQYTHTKDYDAGDIHDAREHMAKFHPAELCAIEEQIARTICRGRP